MIWIALPIAFALSPVDEFLSNPHLNPDDDTGLNSILLRLAFELREGVMNERVVDNYRWEAQTHLWLQEASFPAVGHYHLHANHKQYEFSKRPESSEEGALLSALVPLIQAMPEKITFLETRDNCKLSSHLQELLHTKTLLVICEQSPEKIPSDSLDLVVVRGPVTDVIKWEDKLRPGGVLMGTGFTSNRDEAERVVIYRRSHEIYLAPGGVFWWFRLPD